MDRFVKAMIVFAVFVAAACQGCQTYQNCKPLDRKPCTCKDGDDGYSLCEPDGSGFGQCRCGCLEDCPDLECGQFDDGCGGLLECGSCAVNERCNDDNMCECAHDQCAGACCSQDEACIQGTCRPSGCCPGQSLHVWVEGQATEFVTGDAVSVNLIVLGILPALTDQLSERLAFGHSDENGGFYFDCMDVARTSLGLYLLTHESDEDGPTGRYLLTISPLIEWRSDDEKQCVPGARVVAITTETFDALQAGLPLVDLVQEGFIIGKVLDTNRNPVSGARVVPADDTELPPVYYPDPVFEDFSSSATTSSGVYIIPGEVYITRLTAVKDGYSWSNSIQTAGTVATVAFYAEFVAD